MVWRVSRLASSTLWTKRKNKEPVERLAATQCLQHNKNGPRSALVCVLTLGVPYCVFHGNSDTDERYPLQEVGSVLRGANDGEYQNKKLNTTKCSTTMSTPSDHCMERAPTAFGEHYVQ